MQWNRLSDKCDIFSYFAGILLIWLSFCTAIVWQICWAVSQLFCWNIYHITPNVFALTKHISISVVPNLFRIFPTLFQHFISMFPQFLWLQTLSIHWKCVPTFYKNGFITKWSKQWPILCAQRVQPMFQCLANRWIYSAISSMNISYHFNEFFTLFHTNFHRIQ